MNITFNELRRIKDSLPDGSTAEIAKRCGVSADTVRNYFGGAHYESGEAVGVHFEPGPGGGIVMLEDTTILEIAQEIIARESATLQESNSVE